MKFDLTPSEKLCKYFFEHGLEIDKIAESGKKAQQAAVQGLDLSAFTEDPLSVLTQTIQVFSEDVLIPANSDLAIVRLPRYMPVKNHSHDYIEFIYVYDGCCTQYVNDIPFELKKGDLFLLSPGVFHQLSVYNDETILFYIVVRTSTFDTAFLGLLNQSDMLASFFSHTLYGKDSNSYLMFRTNGDIILREWVLNMYLDYQKQDDYSGRMLSIQFEWLCVHLLRNHIEHLAVNNHDKKITILPVLNYISTHYQNISMNEMAQHFNYSAGHLHRLIKASTGKTLCELTLVIRLKHACELLKNPDINIQEIAEKVGFSDSSNFYKAFKKHYAVTPAQFRKQLLQENTQKET